MASPATASAAVVRPAGTRPVRVMHLLLKLGFGGAEVGVTKIANGTNRARVVTSICSSWEPDALEQQLRDDVRVFRLNRKRSGNDLPAVWRLAQLLRRERPDVLHTHGWATLLEGWAAARMAGVPFVVHGEHGSVEDRKLSVQRWGWNRVDRVLSVSSRLTTKLSKTFEFPEERIITIRNGVDTARFSPSKRAAARAAIGVGDRLAIGTVGRLLPVKDQKVFLDALAAVRARGIAFQAYIAGDGPLREPLEQQATRLGIADSLTFLGQRSDVETVLASLDIFVLSSESEGLSNTVLEAMSAGVPVVATHVGGMDELVVDAETGILVPAKDPITMGEAIIGLATDAPRRTALGAAARRRAEQHFSLDGMIRNYEDFYVALAGHK